MVQTDNCVCCACDGIITIKPVITDGENPKTFHRECYKCKWCKLTLPNVFVYEIDGNGLLCVRCHDMHNPRCPKCNKPVYGEACPVDDVLFHEACFRCVDCGESLTEEYFGTSYKDFKCEPCANLPTCVGCNLPIKSDANGNKYYFCRGENYHEMCFTCNKCDGPMGAEADDMPRLSKDGEKLLCTPCYRAEAPLCVACGDPCVDASVTLTEDDGEPEHFHGECLTCKSCAEAIGEGPIWRKKEEPRPDCYRCNDCHQREAPNCPTCDQIVERNILQVEDTYYHPDCFKCSECNASGEAGVYFKSGEDPVVYVCQKYCRPDDNVVKEQSSSSSSSSD